MFMARAVHRDPFASLFICQRFSLLHFPMRTKAIFDDTQCYSELDFPSTKPPLNLKGEQESEICNASANLEVSGKLNLLMNLNRVPLIVLCFFNFHFPIDFIGGQ